MARAVVAAEIQEIPCPGILEVFNPLAQAVRINAELRRIACAFDVPQLQQVKEVRKGHSIEIVRIKPFLDVPVLHSSAKHLESQAAAVAAAREVWMRFGHHTALVPDVLRHTVV